MVPLLPSFDLNERSSEHCFFLSSPTDNLYFHFPFFFLCFFFVPTDRCPSSTVRFHSPRKPFRESFQGFSRTTTREQKSKRLTALLSVRYRRNAAMHETDPSLRVLSPLRLPEIRPLCSSTPSNSCFIRRCSILNYYPRIYIDLFRKRNKMKWKEARESIQGRSNENVTSFCMFSFYIFLFGFWNIWAGLEVSKVTLFFFFKSK